jgi:hypothetical protein
MYLWLNSIVINMSLAPINPLWNFDLGHWNSWKACFHLILRLFQEELFVKAVLTKLVQLFFLDLPGQKRLDFLKKNSVNVADSICKINLSLPNCE